jgi:hypothetical protein
MRIYQGRRLYAATDLVNFLGCNHSSTLDIRQLTEPSPRDVGDANMELLKQKGIEHELAYLSTLREQGRSVQEIEANGTLQERAASTLEAMREGVEVIYQGAFLAEPWSGLSDFLLKVEGRSNFGLGRTMLQTPSSRRKPSLRMSFSSVYTRTCSPNRKGLLQKCCTWCWVRVGEPRFAPPPWSTTMRWRETDSMTLSPSRSGPRRHNPAHNAPTVAGPHLAKSTGTRSST